MPGIDGLTCLRDIKKNPAYARLPVVQTISVNPADVTKGYAYGATLYVAKPNSYKGWVKILAALLALDWQNPAAITQGQYVADHFVPFAPSKAQATFLCLNR